MAQVTIYGGAGSIGGNKIHIREGSSGLFLDFGIDFSMYSRFYGDFLTPRSGRGIYDYLHLGLLPPIANYRSDLTPPDLTLKGMPQIPVDALLLSHAHMDHVGLAGMLDTTIPLIASGTTLGLIKAMQDSGPARIGSDPIYTKERTPHDERTLVAGRKAAIGRDLIVTDDITDSFRSLISTIPQGKGARINASVSLFHESNFPFSIESYPVDHSIPGATAFLLGGDLSIAYTGDIRTHGRENAATSRFVDAARDTGTLIIEGTRLLREEDHSSPEVSEEEVAVNCREAVAEEEGLVIADFSPRNIERLMIFQEIADTCGRQLVVTAKDAYLLQAMAACGHPHLLPSLLMYGGFTDPRIPGWKKGLSDQIIPVSSDEVKRDPGSYILCFSLYDLVALPDIAPEGGTYISSTCEAFNEEMALDTARLVEWLDRFGICCHGLSGRSPEAVGFHASGHASPQDLEAIVDRIDPDLIIPVHTTAPEWYSRRWEQVVIPQTGEEITC
ncbi:hypothetical protein RJ53_02595 [Methanocalculus chunghsingensis]|uniref:Metallo-beta-lactamase domain-containing protein n=1 Tax=Methanocalculus chunghsingensis TaxID=156457 RepID=A0A8J7W533_9EURY|nr:MBL fold metallo-hydrolase [Methanocalculus chunghsingensis]MBR1368449.1 hypothetical protein [Methanocalculus chunghsingensis]